jgi:hypothetical protein
MNKLNKVLIVICFLVYQQPGRAEKTVSLAEALATKLISCTIRGSIVVPDSLTGRMGYPLLFSIENRIPGSLNLSLESGRRFICNDTLNQNLILTENRVISLHSRQKTEFACLAYCTNKHKGGPGQSFFKIGPLASGLLMKVANFIGLNRIRNKAVQPSVWAVTDNESIEKVVGNNRFETRKLRNFLYQITSRPRPPRSLEPLSWPLVYVAGEVSWDMAAKGPVNISLLDSNGKNLASLVRNKDYPEGKQFYRFNYKDDALVPGRRYKLKLFAAGTEIREVEYEAREE